MKILILSDSHGKNENVRCAIETEKPDMLIHCGDVEGGEDTIEMLAGTPSVPCVFVKGNCDWDSTNPLVRTFKLFGHKFLITHGHMQHIMNSDDALRLRYLAQENECDIVCFGHIHFPVDEESDGVRILNPGSISRPRGIRKKTYMIMEMEENGKYTVEIKYLK